MYQEAESLESKKLNGIQLLTSNEVLDNIQIYDSTVEIVGYVDGIEASRYVGDQQQYRVFKFYLNNANGKRVQIIVWNDDILNVESYIKLNHIIHLDGVQARTPKIARFNNGNVPYELQIRSNTIISDLGKYNPLTLSNIEPEYVKFCDVINKSSRVVIESYIKSNFGAIYNNSLNKQIGCGSITDGHSKLEVHIMNFNKNEYTFSKGDKIKIIGMMQNTVDPPYFVVQNLQDITKIEGYMPLASLIKVTRILKKRKIDGMDPSVKCLKNKKSKQE